jgi:F5/8 type C domain/HYR domain
MNNSINSRKLISTLLILILISGTISVIYPHLIGTSSAQIIRDHRRGIEVRDHRTICIPIGPRDHRCEGLSSIVPPPPVGSTQPPPPPSYGNLEVKVSGDANPNVVWTSASDTSRQKATLFLETKVPVPGAGVKWDPGCASYIWKEEYMRGTEVIPGHWERMRVGEFDQFQMLQGYWTKSSIDPSIYTAKIEAYFPVGTTTIGCSISSYNYNGNIAGDRTPITVKVTVDDIPPTLITPAAIVEDSDSANGKVIEYAVNATDNSGGPVEIQCDPTSGTQFPIGKTSVKCNATDKFGNSIEKIFSVGVIGNVNSGGQDSNTPPSRAVQQCVKMETKNVTTNGFENDPEDYHPAMHAVDGESSTWWSNKGENSWLKIDLGDRTSLCDVQVEWNKGDERKYTFEISASENGNDFKRIFDGANQKGSSSPESYQIDDANARYVMLKVTGSSSGKGWVGVKEIGVFSKP